MVTTQAAKKRLDGRKQNYTCTAVPVLRGTVLKSCSIPSRTTCIQIIPEKYPWYVHPKKDDINNGKLGRNTKENKKEKEQKGKKGEAENKHARRAQAESRGDKVAVCWYDQSYDVQLFAGMTNIRTMR